MSNKYYSPNGNLEVWDTKPEGYFTEEEWQEAHPAPPAPEPTLEEKITMLDADYNQQKADLLTAYQTAMLYGDTNTMDSLKADLVALDEQYDEDYEKIVGGE